MNNGFGGRTLSAAGRKFLLTTKTHLAQHYPQQLRLFKPNMPYTLCLRFFFEAVDTKGFLKGKAASRYKIFDGSNRTKLLEDALKDAGGIDDSQTFTSLWQKTQGVPERTIIWAWSVEEESCPIDELLRHLT